MEFNSGDQVMLKSGGPWMTVSEEGMTVVSVVWISIDGHPHREEYKKGCLVKKEQVAKRGVASSG